MAKQLTFETGIERAKDRFIQLAGGDDQAKTKFVSERIFAMQQLMKNDYSLGIANSNPNSVQLAMLNAAQIGLSLNPVEALAYLVPRDGGIVLDVSYRGILKIATDTGAVLRAYVDVVREKDQFELGKIGEAPTHKYNPFAKDRGDIIGTYCAAEMRDGKFMVETMDLEEIYKVRARSQAYAKKKAGPWVEWFPSMCKKSVVKRASHMWPRTGVSGKLFEAIELANVAEGGYDFDGDATELVSDKQRVVLDQWIDSLRAVCADGKADETVKTLLGLFDIEAIDALPAARYQEFIDTVEARIRAIEEGEDA